MNGTSLLVVLTICVVAAILGYVQLRNIHKDTAFKRPLGGNVISLPSKKKRYRFNPDCKEEELTDIDSDDNVPYTHKSNKHAHLRGNPLVKIRTAVTVNEPRSLAGLHAHKLTNPSHVSKKVVFDVPNHYTHLISASGEIKLRGLNYEPDKVVCSSPWCTIWKGTNTNISTMANLRTGYEFPLPSSLIVTNLTSPPSQPTLRGSASSRRHMKYVALDDMTLPKVVGNIGSADPLVSHSRCDYMGEFWWFFGRRTMMDICVLCSHDSLTYDSSSTISRHDTINPKLAKVANKLLPAHLKGLFVKMARSQTLTVKEQFESGVRYFDFRTTSDQGKWYGVHTMDSKQPLEVYLTELCDAMETHPKECCILTISLHGCVRKGRGTPLDKLHNSTSLWDVVTKTLGHIAVDHTVSPMETTTMSELVQSQRRLFVYIDGWEVIANGDRLAGHTDRLNEICCTTDNLSSVSRDRNYLLKAFKSGSDTPTDGKYCYLRLNSANSTMGIAKSVLGNLEGPVRKLAKHMPEVMDHRVAKLGLHPGSLISYAQLGLYYFQCTLMDVYAAASKTQHTLYHIPQAIETDCITTDGKVRVGWLGIGMEKDLEGTCSISLGELERYEVSRPLLLRNSGVNANLSISLGRDMQKSCSEQPCKVIVSADAARASFDMFRYCFCLTMIKQLQKERDPTSILDISTLLSRTGKYLKPTYVDAPYAGRTLFPLSFVQA